MFMFRSRKSALVRRAWKARKSGLPLAYEPALLQQQRLAEQQLKGPAMQLLRRLTESQLELLVTALESGGGDTGECVLVPRHDDEIGNDHHHHTNEGLGGATPAGGGGGRGGIGLGVCDYHHPHRNRGADPPPPPPPPPHLLMMWLWRWPDLFHQHQDIYHRFQPPDGAALIQSLPFCSARNDHFYVCANPYHWARLKLVETPPPPYSRFNVDLLRPEDAAPSEEDPMESQETGGTYQYHSYSTNGPGAIPWCQVAYWEGRVRVGRLYPVRTPSLNIMGDIPHGEGLCLANLAASPDYVPTEQSRKTKEKIGLGLVLYQEGGGVWVYNRSDIPLFVNSPTLDGGIRRNFSVHKLPPGHLINIFDYEKARLYQKLPIHPDLVHEGPIDQNSVRVSFAKGWGRNYHRQEITECPCWLEILLVPVR